MELKDRGIADQAASGRATPKTAAQGWLEARFTHRHASTLRQQPAPELRFLGRPYTA